MTAPAVRERSLTLQPSEVWLALLLLAAAWRPTCAATPERPASFWADETLLAAPPPGEDISAVLQQAEHARREIRTLRLGAGEWTLPGQNARMPVVGHLRVVGAGANVTFMHTRGSQKVFWLRADSSLQWENLTLTGVTTGMIMYTGTARRVGGLRVARNPT